jgi:two-component system, LytTR family, sensor kinase
MRKQWYSSRWAVVGYHVLAWVLIFLLPMLAPNNNHGQNSDLNHVLFNKIHIGFTFASACIFYSNVYYFVPFYLYKKKVWQYVSLLIGTFLAFFLLIDFLFSYDKGIRYFHKESFFLIIPFIFLWSIGTLFRFASDKVKTDRLLKEKENENLKTELSFLRSQVSPHFLFNVLNNMVALARLKSDKLEPSLIKLSGLMRYMLYESDEDKVLLSREIEYVTSFIDLQKLRFGKEMTVNVNMNEPQEDYMIEPMLLIPFIENAFKHGTGMIVEPEIDISLEVSKGLLDFRVRNKFNGESTEIKDKTSGIGLVNVMRRLNLLYEKKHILSISKEDGWFAVALQLKLQP